MQALEFTLAVILVCAGLLLNTTVLLYFLFRVVRAYGRRRTRRVMAAPPVTLLPAHR